MQTTLKIIAGSIVALMGTFWLWGLNLLEHPITAGALGLPVGAALFCWLAWSVRSRRRRAAGVEYAIEPKIARDRAIVAGALMIICFFFALALDQLGDRPHQTFISGALAAAWAAVGIVSLIFCSVCLVGGGES